MAPWRVAGRIDKAVAIALGLIAAASLGFLALTWHHEKLADAARAREMQQRELIEHIVHQGDKLQLTLVLVQNQLESLALAAAQLIQYGTPDGSSRTYWSEDFLSPSTRPGILIESANPPRGQHQSAPGVSLQESIARPSNRSTRSFPSSWLSQSAHQCDPRIMGSGQTAIGVTELKLVLEQGLFMHFPGHVLERKAIFARANGMPIPNQNAGRAGRALLDDEGDDVLMSLTSPIRDPRRLSWCTFRWKSPWTSSSTTCRKP